MNAFAKTGCGCGCSPCTCAPPPDACNDFCVPRPCFFPGQLVTADDLNAVMDYMRARERMFAKLAFGWGILGGMRLLSTGTTKSVQFMFDPMLGLNLPANLTGAFPNPQVVPGSIIQISAGAAFDSMGHSLSLCGPRLIDLVQLSKALGVVQELKTCANWFGTDFCSSVTTIENITGAAFWVIAEYTETPTRPVPGLAGGGACDPEPHCDFTRKLEGVRIRLVPDLPALFFMHGCLEDPDIPGLQAFIEFVFDNTSGEAGEPAEGEAAVPGVTTGANDALRNQFSCLGFKVIPNYYDFMSQVAFETCCSQPAVALGRVILATEVSATLRATLGDAPYYTFIDDAFPYRRLVSNVANTHLIRREVPEAVQMCEDLAASPPAE